MRPLSSEAEAEKPRNDEQKIIIKKYFIGGSFARRPKAGGPQR
jgi:hypothetical protein